jgi:hypothetical protein
VTSSRWLIFHDTAFVLASILLIFFGFFIATGKYSVHLPVVSTCSAAISAACHPPDGDEQAWAYPLAWGVVKGRCSLSTANDISSPVPGESYD